MSATVVGAVISWGVILLVAGAVVRLAKAAERIADAAETARNDALVRAGRAREEAARG